MLSVDDLSVEYNGRKALHNATMSADTATLCGLIGHNGAGKSTLLRAVVGLIRSTAGSVRFDGCDLGGLSVSDRLRCGVAMVPQGNRVFDRLTVRENLLINTASGAQRPAIVESACEQFPRLRELLSRPAGVLSGGERQTLALAMAMSGAPRLLLLDEPSAGLDCQSVNLAFERIAQLRMNRNMTIVIAEQNVAALLAIADMIYALRAGEVVFHGRPSELLDSPDRLRKVFL